MSKTDKDKVEVYDILGEFVENWDKFRGHASPFESSHEVFEIAYMKLQAKKAEWQKEAVEDYKERSYKDFVKQTFSQHPKLTSPSKETGGGNNE